MKSLTKNSKGRSKPQPEAKKAGMKLPTDMADNIGNEIKDIMDEFSDFDDGLRQSVPQKKTAVPDNALVMPIGISGSGKSTWIKTLDTSNAVVVSPDEIRKELTGSISGQTKNTEVFALVKQRAADALKAGKSVILDATNLNPVQRKDMIDSLQQLSGKSFDVYYKLFEVSAQTAKQRIQDDIARGKERANVPDHAVDRMFNAYKDSVKDLAGMKPFPEMVSKEQKVVELMRSFGQQISRPAFPPHSKWRTEYLWKNEKGELIWHISKVKSDWEAVHEIEEG